MVRKPYSHWWPFLHRKRLAEYIRTPTNYYGPFNHAYLMYQIQSRNDRFKSNLWVTEEALDELGIRVDNDPYMILLDFGPLKYIAVYNVEQIKACEKSLGFSFMRSADIEITYKQSESALKALKDRHGLEVCEGTGYAAFDPKNEAVFMPNISQFVERMGGSDGEAHYWATMWHEVIHWTGHHSRLDRHGNSADLHSFEDNYASEELVAEIGAAYLCAHYGIAGKLQHPQYISSWLSVLKRKRGEALAKAFREAHQAAKWVIRPPRSR